jgi:hypothetical protein
MIKMYHPQKVVLFYTIYHDTQVYHFLPLSAVLLLLFSCRVVVAPHAHMAQSTADRAEIKIKESTITPSRTQQQV